MMRVSKSGKAGQKGRGRLKSRLYVAWLALVCVGLVCGGRLDDHAGRRPRPPAVQSPRTA